jgi:predicted component of type VI protein secretion system
MTRYDFSNGSASVTNGRGVSAIASAAHGPFFSFAAALEFAEQADGSIYHCVDDEISASEGSAA